MLFIGSSCSPFALYETYETTKIFKGDFCLRTKLLFCLSYTKGSESEGKNYAIMSSKGCRSKLVDLRLLLCNLKYFPSIFQLFHMMHPGWLLTACVYLITDGRADINFDLC